MQLYALDEKQGSVLAEQAARGKTHFCPECGESVRVRRGDVRLAHFYHHHPRKQCRQSGKSLRHLGVQLYLLELLPRGECHLEKKFPDVNRIADVVWEPKKLIFEVQCSPITKREVQNRNRDYEKMGYQVVWLLHDCRFGNWKVSAAESFLQTAPFYYTNIDRHRRGIIYDRFQIIQKGVRQASLAPLPVRLNHPAYCEKTGTLFFQGDYVSLKAKKELSPSETQYLSKAENLFKNTIKNRIKWPFFLFNKLLIRPYKELLIQFLTS